MIYVWILLAAILLWLLYEWWEHTQIEYTSTEVESKKFKQNECLKLCLITDLHNNKKSVKEISSALGVFSPDLILVSGDCVDKRKNEQKNAIVFLKAISCIAPVFYSLGNHEEELRGKKIAIWNEYVSRLPEGVTLLDNVSVTEWIRGKEVCISGLSLPEEFYCKGKLYDNPDKLPGLENGNQSSAEYHVLMAHHPEYMNLYEKYKPDVVLSGHLHGGLLRLPVIGGVVSPRLRIPREDAGTYVYPFGTLVVSRGLGSHTIPLRFFNRVEINFIEIHGENKKKTESKQKWQFR